MMRALIADDEFHARQELAALLEETGQFSVVGRCGDALEALQAIRREQPDVLFLDVQMPVVNGFELLAMIDPDLMPSVVFVTAYDEFAVKAFEESATDYLLKPLDRRRLSRTVERLRAARNEGPGPAPAAPEIRRIPCQGARTIKLVAASEVEYARSGAGGVSVVCPQGEFSTDLTLRVLEARASLVRCHKQYLVNLDRIDEIRLGDDPPAVIRTRSGHSVPVGRRFLPRIRAVLGI